MPNTASYQKELKKVLLKLDAGMGLMKNARSYLVTHPTPDGFNKQQLNRSITRYEQLREEIDEILAGKNYQRQDASLKLLELITQLKDITCPRLDAIGDDDAGLYADDDDKRQAVQEKKQEIEEAFNEFQRQVLEAAHLTEQQRAIRNSYYQYNKDRREWEIGVEGQNINASYTTAATVQHPAGYTLSNVGNALKLMPSNFTSNRKRWRGAVDFLMEQAIGKYGDLSQVNMPEMTWEKYYKSQTHWGVFGGGNIYDCYNDFIIEFKARGGKFPDDSLMQADQNRIWEHIMNNPGLKARYESRCGELQLHAQAQQEALREMDGPTLNINTPPPAPVPNNPAGPVTNALHQSGIGGAMQRPSAPTLSDTSSQSSSRSRSSSTSSSSSSSSTNSSQSDQQPGQPAPINMTNLGNSSPFTRSN